MIDSKTAELETILDVARAMCAAARTAPKARGIDNLHAFVLTGDEIEKLAAEMEHLSPELNYGFFVRDAGNIRNSAAVVLLGSAYAQYALEDGCGFCQFKNCGGCRQSGGVCVYPPLDLGIAIGSAVSVAANARVDSRVMFSVGRAALSLGLFDKNVKMAMGIPLSVSAKSPFFDRK